MKIESNKNWTTCLRLNTGDGSPRVFLLNSHFLGSVPSIAKTYSKHPIYWGAFFCRELRSVDTAVGAERLTDVGATGEALASKR